MNRTTRAYRFLAWLTLSALCALASQYLAVSWLSWGLLFIAGLPLLALGLRAILKQQTSLSLSAVVVAVLLVFLGNRSAALLAIVVGLVLAALIELIKSSVLTRVSAMVDHRAPLVRVVRTNREELIAFANVEVGDRLVVQPGERVPVDGRLRNRRARVLPWFSTEPELLSRGDLVASGDRAVNKLVLEATAVGKSTTWYVITTLARQMVRSVPPLVARIDQWSLLAQLVWLAGCVIAALLGMGERSAWLALAGVWWLGPLYMRFATLFSIAWMLRRGVLLKSWNILARLRRAQIIIFDKGGTVTLGLPDLVEVRTTGDLTREDVLRLAAAIEHHVDHPIARSLKRVTTQENWPLPFASALTSVPGSGLIATVEGEEFLLGNASLMRRAEAAIPADFLARAEQEESQGASVSYLAKPARVLAMFVFNDVPRGNAQPAIRAAQRLKLEPQLLSGDERLPVAMVARMLGIEAGAAHARLSPEAKAEHVRQLRARTPIVVADPSADQAMLAQASVGIGFLSYGQALADPSTQVLIRRSEMLDVTDTLARLRGLSVQWWLVTGLGTISALAAAAAVYLVR